MGRSRLSRTDHSPSRCPQWRYSPPDAAAATTAPQAEGGGGETLTVGSDVPYPPFEEFGQTKSEFTGFDVELMEAIGEKIGREVRIPGHLLRHDLPRPRPGQVRSGRLGDDDHRRTRRRRSTSPNPYYLSEQAILVKEGHDRLGGRSLKGATVGAQQGTTGAEFVEEKADAGELRPYPQGPDAVNAAQGRHRRRGRDRHPGRRKRGQEHRRGIEVAEAIPTEEEYGIAVAQGDEELLEELNEGLARNQG